MLKFGTAVSSFSHLGASQILPDAVVDVNSVEVFKSRVDNFWK